MTEKNNLSVKSTTSESRSSSTKKPNISLFSLIPDLKERKDAKKGNISLFSLSEDLRNQDELRKEWDEKREAELKERWMAEWAKEKENEDDLRKREAELREKLKAELAEEMAEWAKENDEAGGEAAKWEQLEDFTTNRNIANGIAVNDHQVLVVGGMREASCEYYDARTKKWAGLGIDLPFGLGYFGMARVGNKVYVVGGTSDGYTVRNDMLSLDLPPGGDLSKLSTRQWKPEPSMKGKRVSFGCVSDARYVYVFGGAVFAEDDPLDTAERYDTETEQWEDLPRMPEKMKCAAGMVGTNIYVVGDGSQTTLVFDTSRQQWDSSPPDMRNRVEFPQIVVVDHFLVVTDWSGKESIEVLDTRRNQWDFAPATARKCGFAMFCKESNQIIAAAGRRSFAIDFDKGILPPAFQLSDRGQKVHGDVDYGPDRLGLKLIAQVLAEALVYRDVDPPFVLAILGKWGNGKSFFFNMMLDHIIYLQKKEATEAFQKNFAGHTYVVKFSAWTYSKECLMSSFMYRILEDLGKQLAFEKVVEESRKKLGKNALVKGKISAIEVYLGLSRGEFDYLLESGIDQDTIDAFKKADEESDQPTKRLLKAIDKKNQDELDALSEKKKSITKNYKKNRTEVEAEYQKKRKDEEDKIQKHRYLKNLEICIARKKAEEEWKNEVQEEVKNLVLPRGIEFKQAFDDDDKENLKDLEKTVNDLKKTKENVLKYWKFFKGKNIVWKTSIILFVLFSIIAVVLFLVFKDEVNAVQRYISGIVAASLSFISPAIATIKNGLKNVDESIAKVEPYIKKFKEKIEDLEKGTSPESNPELKRLHEELVSIDEKGKEALKGLEEEEKKQLGNIEQEETKELNKIKEEEKEIQDRMLLREGESLREKIANTDKASYEKNLGIVHKVQHDLQGITDSMFSQASEGIFPRGIPRIILFVDDLDRCTQEQVVQVIEALQLLVKTKLFVAVLAIDPRYVVLSIEKKYKEILRADTAPSGMDYLEKIVQIPFRLPGVGDGDVKSFIFNQLEIKPKNSPDSQATGTTGAPSNPSASTPSTQDAARKSGSPSDTPADAPASKASAPASKASAPASKASAPASKASAPSSRETLPSIRVLFEEEEAEMMVTVFEVFSVGPRCMRRIVNVFKILQVIWQRDTTGKFQADMNLKRATLFLMLLAADESTRGLTYKIFDWMESRTMKFHRVKDKKNLANLFKEEILKSDKSFSDLPTYEDTLIGYIEEYLSEYKWENIEQWRGVTSKFMLARCFSFFRDPSLDSKEFGKERGVSSAGNVSESKKPENDREESEERRPIE